MPISTTRAGLVLIAISLVILIAGTSYLPLLDRDEPRFSRATVEMMQRGDWVVPWFNDGYRFDKPPLTYWMMAVGYAVFGINELGARLHAIVTSTLVTLLLFVFGRRLFTLAVGFGAAFAWATCLQVFVHGRLALADMPMVLAVLIAHMALWELLFGGESGRYGLWFWAFWLALAGGFLAKGPIAVAVPAITAGLTRLLVGRRGLPWRRLQIPVGLPLALALVGAWGIPTLLRTQGAFWDVGIGEHVVRRGIAAFNDRPIVPFYYFVTIFLSLFPWSANLGQLVAELRNNWRDDKNKFLLAWIAGPFLIFSFYSTQLPHYTLPAFPAVLLLVFRSGADSRLFPTWSRRLYWGAHALFGIVFAGVALYAGLLTLPESLAGVQSAVVALAGTMLALQATALVFARAARPTGDTGRGRLAPSYATILVAAAATVVFAASIRPASAPIRIRDALAGVPKDAPHVARGYAEPSLVFYADAFWDFDGSGPGRVHVDAPGPAVFLFRLGERDLDRLFRPGATDPLATGTVEEAARRAGVPSSLIDSSMRRARLQGFNFARSTWTDLAIFYRE